MKLIVNEDRTTVSLGTWGTENENNYEVLNFEIPEKFNDYNKRIVYYLDDERKWDLISNNRILIPNSVTKYERVKAYIWMTKSEEITLKYACDGTETGNYYFTYDNTNYYFTMPEVEENDELIFDVSTSKLKLNNVEIQTSSTGTGTELEFITLINAEEDFRTKLFEMDFYENENADGIIPTQEEVDGFNSMITLMNNKITEVDEVLDGKVDEVDDKIAEVDAKIQEIDQEITGVENLDIDVSDKVDGDVTITLTKKDASTKTVVLSDGTSLEFNWNGTSLGIKTDDDSEYTYVNLQGVQGPKGDTGEAFTIKKTYPSVEAMNADFNNMQVGDYVMIASSVEVQDNAKLYTKGEQAWIFISDFSGAQGIKGETGETPNIQIGTVQSGAEFNVTRSGTNENPVLNFTLVPGEKGDKGDTGNTGNTGNGISSISKTGTSGLVDTYTITFTNSNTTNFTVTNGRGISSIAKTSTSGLVDTYTITYNDGTISTFEVTNGEDGEVTQAQLDELKSHVDDLETLVDTELDTNTVEGTKLDASDSAEYRGKIEIKGNTYQKQLSGKNLFNHYSYPNNNTVNGVTMTNNRDGSFTLNGTCTQNNTRFILGNDAYIGNLVNEGNVTQTAYYISGSCVKSQSSSSARTVIRLNYDTGTDKMIPLENLETALTISKVNPQDDRTTSWSWGIVLGEGDSFNNFTIKYQVEKGSVGTDWEEFCGGQTSPNPDYPQEIKVVTGNNTLKQVGKNVFSIQNKIKVVGSAATTNLTDDNINYFEMTGKNQWGNISFLFKNVKNENMTLSAIFTQRIANLNTKIRLTAYGTNVVSYQTSDLNSLGSTDYNLTNNLPKEMSILFNSGDYEYILLRFWNNATSTALSEDTDMLVDNIQLEKNTTPTPYEPYKEKSYILNLGGKNLYGISDYHQVFNGVDVYIENGIITLNGTSNASGTLSIDPKEEQILTGRYTLTQNLISGSIDGAANINLRNVNDNTVIEGTPLSFAQQFRSFTLENNNIKYGMYIPSGTIFDNYKFSPQLVVGSTPDYNFEPYVINSIELCKIGDYQDYLYKENGNWYKYGAIDKVILDGSEEWVRASATDKNRFVCNTLFDTIIPENQASIGSLASDKFIPVSANNTSSKVQGIAIAGSGKFVVYCEATKDYGNGSQFAEWLSNNNITVYYALSTPTTTQITDTTLISQLEALSKAKWFKGVNHFWTETNNLEPELTGTYKQSNILRIEALEQAIENLQNI